MWNLSLIWNTQIGLSYDLKNNAKYDSVRRVEGSLYFDLCRKLSVLILLMRKKKKKGLQMCKIYYRNKNVLHGEKKN